VLCGEYGWGLYNNTEYLVAADSMLCGFKTYAYFLLFQKRNLIDYLLVILRDHEKKVEPKASKTLVFAVFNDILSFVSVNNFTFLRCKCSGRG